MVIQHNLPAQNTNSNIKKNNNIRSKHTKKLSSGYKINCAADNAAALAISEKMRSQIRGLEQTVSNLTDGISLIQTADGALNESQAILQRMRELAVQSANDTNVAADRNAIQKEVDFLIEEVDRIAKQTEFNEGIYPLLGGGTKMIPDPSYASELGNISVDSSRGGISIYAKDDPSGYLGSTDTFGCRLRIKSGGKTLDLHLPSRYPSSGMSIVPVKEKVGDNIVYEYHNTADNIHFRIEQSFNISKVTSGSQSGEYCDIHYNFINLGSSDLDYSFMIKMDPIAGDMGAAPELDGSKMNSSKLVQFGSGTDGTMICNPQSFPALTCNVTAVVNGDNIVNPPTSAFYGNMWHKRPDFPDWSTMEGTTPPDKYDSSSNNYHYAVSWLDKHVAAGGSYETNTLYGVSYPMISSGSSSKSLDDKIWIQAGANSDQSFSVFLVDASAEKLGIQDINITSHQKSEKAISKIDGALNTVSGYRSQFGACQNRMEHAIANASNTQENTQAAESRIRDADIAKEMVLFSKSQILLDAAQSMLAQCNSKPELILELLH